MLALFRCVLQRRFPTIQTYKIVSTSRPAAVIGCETFNVELHALRHVIAACSGSISHAKQPMVEQDQHQCWSSGHQHNTESEFTPFSFLAQALNARHLTSRHCRAAHPHSHAFAALQALWSRRSRHSYSTADIIKKLRIPSKQVPNPDEACRLARMHEWQVKAIITAGLVM